MDILLALRNNLLLLVLYQLVLLSKESATLPADFQALPANNRSGASFSSNVKLYLMLKVKDSVTLSSAKERLGVQ